MCASPGRLISATVHTACWLGPAKAMVKACPAAPSLHAAQQSGSSQLPAGNPHKCARAGTTLWSLRAGRREVSADQRYPGGLYHTQHSMCAHFTLA